ncbi:hypothetical protein TNCV_2808711 [Trichonephila clavipes]|nr:hypothetical protein TNCV_2808711 [Trichonephila clavipes]
MTAAREGRGSFAWPGSSMKKGRFVPVTFRSERMRVLYRSRPNDRLRVVLVLVHIDITPPQDRFVTIQPNIMVWNSHFLKSNSLRIFEKGIWSPHSLEPTHRVFTHPQGRIPHSLRNAGLGKVVLQVETSVPVVHDMMDILGREALVLVVESIFNSNLDLVIVGKSSSFRTFWSGPKM